jgi:mRNA interferase RelE/StbE
MSCRIEFIPEAVLDYKRLDGSVKKVVTKKLDELSENPFLGVKLGNRFDVDLSDFYKIYIAKKSYRIVYRLIAPTKIEIIEIWGIGKRDKLEIYREIEKRLRSR